MNPKWVLLSFLYQNLVIIIITLGGEGGTAHSGQ
jgi:hypothetical protein